MVQSAGGVGPQQVVFQQTAPVAQQDVRTRNEQTQPRHAPSASSQNTNGQRDLRTSDDTADNRQDNDSPEATQNAAASTSNRRGSLLDLTA